MDVAFESGDEKVVGEGREIFEIGAADHFREKGSGGGADGAAVALEASVLHDAVI